MTWRARCATAGRVESVIIGVMLVVIPVLLIIEGL